MALALKEDKDQIGSWNVTFSRRGTEWIGLQVKCCKREKG